MIEHNSPNSFRNIKHCPCGHMIPPKLIHCPECMGIPDPSAFKQERAKPRPRVKREPEPGFEFDKSIQVK
jgi:hypothetical protein